MKKIFNTLVKNASFSKAELLNWRNLCPQELLEFTQSLLFDIDYICIVLSGSNFLADPTVRAFLSGQHGRYFKNWKKQVIRGQGEGALFCQCGNMLGAILLNKEEGVDNNSFGYEPQQDPPEHEYSFLNHILSNLGKMLTNLR